MRNIRILLAAGGLALFALNMPTWADECDFDSSFIRISDNSICFGVNWKNATVEKITEVDVSARTEFGRTPLHWAAAFNENPVIIEALLKAGAGINTRDKYGNTPLDRAASRNENPAVVEALLKADADVNARNDDGATPLHWAAKPAVVEALLKAGADVNARDKYGNTPLHRAAAFNENPVIIEALMRAGADVNARKNGGLTPLHMAVRFGVLGVTIKGPQIEALLKAGANPNIKDREGKTVIDDIDEDENHYLKNTSTYWALNDARYNFPSDD